MKITLDEGYNAMCDFVYLGYVGEVNAREISVLNYAIPEATAYKLKIEYPDKTVYEIPIKNGICSLGASIFKTACEVKCQIIAYAVEGEVYKLVRKSDIFKQEIRSSIDESGIPSYEESLDALDKILQYESNSKEYAERAEAAAIKSEESESKSTLSASNASNSEQSAKTSEENAKLSESNSKVSESNAKQSELNAKASEEVAKQYSEDAKTYSLNAKSSEDNAKVSEKNAQTYSESAERFSEIASTASQNAENSKDSANTYANNAKASASSAKLSETNASKSETATAGYAKTAKTNADSTAADKQAVQTLAEQVTADKATVADHAAQVAEDRTAAETAAQTAQAVADSLPDDYVTAVGKIAENTAEINNTNTEVSELKEDLADIKVLTTIPLTIVDGYFLNYINGNTSTNDISCYAKISVKPNTTYYITTLLAGNRGICFYDGDTFISGFNYTTSGESLIDYEVTTPANCTVLGVSRLIESGGNNSIVVKDYELDVNLIRQRVANLEDEIITTTNVVGSEEISYTDKCYIRTPAFDAVDFTPITLNNMRCFVCDCVEGEPFTLYGTPRDNTATRPYMFVNSSGNVYYRSEITEQINNRVIFAPCTGKLVVNFLNTSTCYVFRGVYGISDNLGNYIKFEREPLTNLPSYILNNLSYKPIGSLDKGYLCLSCDDGAEELATYTIPMIEAKGIPCTFALWSTSAVLANYSADVVDAIENHGCELAQHGNQIWAEKDGAIAFTEEKLYSFFDKEQAVWDSLGLVPKSAVCPAHYNNALVRAVAGGRFGVVRSGIDYVDNHYEYYTSGARSNLFGMSSQNVNGGSLDYWKSVIDYAYDNHKIINLYWHDWDLSTEQKNYPRSGYRLCKDKRHYILHIGRNRSYFVTKADYNKLMLLLSASGSRLRSMRKSQDKHMKAR
jgi:hypothetical protein|nr:MAG TPA: L SHAPED TAIL FIBER PROTEIN [Caudoviricetes sp.]